MRRTPPVVAHLQAQPAVQAAVALVATLISGGLVLLAVSHHPGAWPAGVLVPLSAVWAWVAAAVRPRRLRWDGQAWWLSAADGDQETSVRLTLLIDLDDWMLLQARPGPCWLPLSRRQQAGHWTALRATLFSAPQVPT